MQPTTTRSIENLLLRLYTDLQPILPPEGISLEIPAGSSLIRFAVETAANNERALTSCERQVLDFMATAERRLTMKEIRAGMEAAGNLWGKSTVQNALAELVNRKLLVNDRDKRGYGTPIETQLQPEPIARKDDDHAHDNSNGRLTVSRNGAHA